MPAAIELPALASVPADAVLVVGYGNPLRSDDGVGPAVAALVAADPRMAGAAVLVEHQLAPELAADFAEARRVILIDAADGAGPGEVAVRRLGSGPQEEPASTLGDVGAGGPPLTHHVSPSSLAGIARTLYGAEPEVLVVSVGAASFELGEMLTPEVAAAVPLVVEAAIRAALGGTGDA